MEKPRGGKISGYPGLCDGATGGLVKRPPLMKRKGERLKENSAEMIVGQ